jgi:hypothetical protein
MVSTLTIDYMTASHTCMRSKARRARSRMTEGSLAEAAVMVERGRVLPLEEHTGDHCVSVVEPYTTKVEREREWYGA